MTHDLKVWPEFFAAIDKGEKAFELRKDDRGFELGDDLRLWFFDPETGKKNGHSIFARVTSIVRGEWLAPGCVCMGIRVDVRGYDPDHDETRSR